jgi:hypothetical protein
MVSTSRGASPTFESFNTSQFNTNGNKIVWKGGPGNTNLTATNIDQAARMFTASGQQGAILIPPLIFADNLWNATETNNATFPPTPCLTNLITLLKGNGWLNTWSAYGKPWVFFDYSWQATNRDANGNIQWNPVYFPSGPTNLLTLRTNGMRAILWTQDHPAADTSASVGISSIALINRDFPYMVTNWGADGFWWDTDQIAPTPYYGKFAAAQALSTLGRGIYLDVGTGQGDELSNPLRLIVSATRPNNLGDPGTWSISTNTWNYIFTNGLNKLVKPGLFLNLNIVGFWGRTTDEHVSHCILIAMMSAPFYYGWDFTSSTIATNTQFLDILTDKAVIAADRTMITNGCQVFCKPLGSAIGPSYAISVLNLSNAASTVTINFTNSGVPPAGAPFFFQDIINRTNDLAYIVSKTITVPSHGSVLWKVTPAADQSPDGGQTSVRVAPLVSMAPNNPGLFYPQFQFGSAINDISVNYWFGRWGADGICYWVAEQGAAASGLILQHSASLSTKFGSTYMSLLPSGITANASAIPTNTAVFLTATNTFTTNTINNITQGQRTTIRANWLLTGAVGAAARIILLIDQDNNGTYEETNNIVSFSGVAATSMNTITDTLSPGARCYFTNVSDATATAVFSSAKITRE